MLILHDKATLAHRTVELLAAKIIPALECPERVEVILAALEASGAHELRHISVGSSASDSTDSSLVRQSLTGNHLLDKLLLESHDKGYLHHLRAIHSDWVTNGLVSKDENLLPECFHARPFLTSSQKRPPRDIFARLGYYAFDMSTGICKDTWTAAVASANLAVEAARLLTTDEQTRNTVLALCRPPGHHCTTDMAGGYCYINNVVVAVHALRHYVQVRPRVAVMDLDFHHGNGTQHSFYRDPTVFYASIHGLEEYPYYTGFEDEVGEGEGEGYNLNIPLPPHASTDRYMEALGTAISAIVQFRPDHLVISLGFDTFDGDPLGSFKIPTSGYEAIAAQVRHGLPSVPAIIALEGGYVLEQLGQNMLAFLKGWEA